MKPHVRLQYKELKTALMCFIVAQIVYIEKVLDEAAVVEAPSTRSTLLNVGTNGI